MPIPFLIPAAIAAGGSLLNSFFGSQSARRNTDRTIEANRELAQYSYAQNKEMAQLAYERDLQMWEKQNAYNSPEAQMARLKAAGLNPHLVYGSGTVAGNQSGPAPSFNPARFEPPNVEFRYQAMQLPEILSAYQDFKLKQAQIDNVEAHTENVNAQTLSEGLRPMLMRLQGKAGEFDLQRRQALAPYQQTVTEMDAQKSMTDWNIQLERLKNVRVEGEAMQADLLFKKYRNDWLKIGITSSDNMFLRILVRMMSESGLSFPGME